MLGAPTRCDEQAVARFVHGGRVPDVSGIDDALARPKLDDVVFSVEILDDVDASGEQHDELLTRGVALPRVPCFVLGDDAHEPPFVAVASERLSECLEKFWRPLEIGNGDGPSSQPKVNERL